MGLPGEGLAAAAGRPSDFFWIVVAGGVTCFLTAFAIGANDVANTFSSSVGSKALPLWVAICLAAVLESVGATLLGGAVTDSVRSKIIDFEVFEGTPTILMSGMLCSLMGAGGWLFLANQFGLPVSTTHSIIGALLGFGLASGNVHAVRWGQIAFIVASWLLAPVVASCFGGSLFVLLRTAILRKPNSLRRAKRGLWLLIWLVTFTFSVFLVFKNYFEVNCECEQLLPHGVVVRRRPCRLSRWADRHVGLALAAASALSVLLTACITCFVYRFASSRLAVFRRLHAAGATKAKKEATDGASGDGSRHRKTAAATAFGSAALPCPTASRFSAAAAPEESAGAAAASPSPGDRDKRESATAAAWISGSGSTATAGQCCSKHEGSDSQQRRTLSRQQHGGASAAAAAATQETTKHFCSVAADSVCAALGPGVHPLCCRNATAAAAADREKSSAGPAAATATHTAAASAANTVASSSDSSEGLFCPFDLHARHVLSPRAAAAAGMVRPAVANSSSAEVPIVEGTACSSSSSRQSFTAPYSFLIGRKWRSSNRRNTAVDTATTSAASGNDVFLANKAAVESSVPVCSFTAPSSVTPCNGDTHPSSSSVRRSSNRCSSNNSAAAAAASAPGRRVKTPEETMAAYRDAALSSETAAAATAEASAAKKEKAEKKCFSHRTAIGEPPPWPQREPHATSRRQQFTTFALLPLHVVNKDEMLTAAAAGFHATEQDPSTAATSNESRMLLSVPSPRHSSTVSDIAAASKSQEQQAAASGGSSERRTGATHAAAAEAALGVSNRIALETGDAWLRDVLLPGDADTSVVQVQQEHCMHQQQQHARETQQEVKAQDEEEHLGRECVMVVVEQQQHGLAAPGSERKRAAREDAEASDEVPEEEAAAATFSGEGEEEVKVDFMTQSLWKRGVNGRRRSPSQEDASPTEGDAVSCGCSHAVAAEATAGAAAAAAHEADFWQATAAEMVTASESGLRASLSATTAVAAPVKAGKGLPGLAAGCAGASCATKRDTQMLQLTLNSSRGQSEEEEDEACSTPRDTPLSGWQKRLHVRWRTMPWFKDIHSEGQAEDELVARLQSGAEVFEAETEIFFSACQVVSACMGCIAHSANDTANAIGPFAAILTIYQTGTAAAQMESPWYVLLFGGLSMSLGLALLGYKVIKTVGVKLVKITPARGFAMDLGAAWTVLIFSALGIPLSTTHCAVGSTVGVGLMEPRQQQPQVDEKREQLLLQQQSGGGRRLRMKAFLGRVPLLICPCLNVSSVNWKLFGGVFASWIVTILLSGLVSAALFSFAAYSPRLLR